MLTEGNHYYSFPQIFDGTFLSPGLQSVKLFFDPIICKPHSLNPFQPVASNNCKSEPERNDNLTVQGRIYIVDSGI